MQVEEIRQAFREYHFKDGYREEEHVRMDNEAFPHTFNASGLENQIKEIIIQGVKPIEDKLFCIQPCFRRFDVENVEKNGYSIFFQMCGKAHFTPNLKEELPLYFQKHLDFFVEKLKLDKSKLWFTIFGGGRIATIGDTEMPLDTRSKEMLQELGINPNKIVAITNPAEKGEIDNFLVRFEREWENYAGYGIDIYYDLGESKQLGAKDILPGTIKGGRFLEISTTWICDYWRTSSYGETVVLEESPIPLVVSGVSLERLAFVLQDVASIFEIDSYSQLFSTIKSYNYSNLETKKLIALLVPLYYIISEGNKPAGGSKTKNRDLRVLYRDIFDIIDSNSFEWLLDHFEKDTKLVSQRKTLFANLGIKDISFFMRTYAEILAIYAPIYNTIIGKHREILDITTNEKVIYLEYKYQNFKK